LSASVLVSRPRMVPLLAHHSTSSTQGIGDAGLVGHRGASTKGALRHGLWPPRLEVGIGKHRSGPGTLGHRREQLPDQAGRAAWKQACDTVPERRASTVGCLMMHLEGSRACWVRPLICLTQRVAGEM